MSQDTPLSLQKETAFHTKSGIPVYLYPNPHLHSFCLCLYVKVSRVAVPLLGEESPVIRKHEATVSLTTMFCAPGVTGSSSVFGTAVSVKITLKLPPQAMLSVLSSLFAKIIPISSFLSVVLNTVYEKIWVCVIIYLVFFFIESLIMKPSSR